MKDHEYPAYVCSHIFHGTQPILFVSRADGDWQFLCGGIHGQEELPRVIGINHVFKGDETLVALLDLPPEWEAERSSIDSIWIRRHID